MPISLPADCRLRFQGVRRLATGGYGTVWLARQIALDRLVAVKVLDTPSTPDPGHRSRFIDEARITSHLSHPNIVVVLDYGASDEGAWIAYEYVDGPPLRARLDRGALDWREACDMVVQAASALAMAHGAGVVHRDIKPENLLVSGPGVVKVADFGIARWTASNRTATEAGLILGTPAYLSPEVIQGAEPDESLDLYALSVTLYELLCGTTPFGDCEPYEILRRTVGNDVPDPTRRALGLPGAVATVLHRGLSRTPAQRFPSAEALLHAIVTAVEASGADGSRSSATVMVPTLSAQATRPQRTLKFDPAASPTRSWRSWARPLGGILIALAAVAALALGRAPSRPHTTVEVGPSSTASIARSWTGTALVDVETPAVGRVTVTLRAPLPDPGQLCLVDSEETCTIGQADQHRMRWSFAGIEPDQALSVVSRVTTTRPGTVLGQCRTPSVAPCVGPTTLVMDTRILVRGWKDTDRTLQVTLTPFKEGRPVVRHEWRSGESELNHQFTDLEPSSFYRLDIREATKWGPVEGIVLRTKDEDHSRRVNSTLRQLVTDDIHGLVLVNIVGDTGDTRLWSVIDEYLRRPRNRAISIKDLCRLCGLTQHSRGVRTLLERLNGEVTASERQEIVLTALDILGPAAEPYFQTEFSTAKAGQYSDALLEQANRWSYAVPFARLRDELRNSRRYPVAQAAQLAGRAHSDQAARLLGEWFEKPPRTDHMFQLYLLYMIGALPPETAADFILGHLAHPIAQDPRNQALCRLAALRGRRRGQALQALEKHTPQSPAEVTVRAQLGSATARRHIEDLTGPSRESVLRCEALSVLADLNHVESIPTVEQALADPDPYVSASAAVSLARMGRVETAPALHRQVTEGRDPWGAALWARAQLDPVGSVALILERLASAPKASTPQEELSNMFLVAATSRLVSSEVDVALASIVERRRMGDAAQSLATHIERYRTSQVPFECGIVLPWITSIRLGRRLVPGEALRLTAVRGRLMGSGDRYGQDCVIHHGLHQIGMSFGSMDFIARTADDLVMTRLGATRHALWMNRSVVGPAWAILSTR